MSSGTARPNGRFRLGNLVVDPVDGKIVGPAGAEQLDPKVMEVFGLLAGRAGQVVGRDELLDKLWKDRVVGDEVISRSIYQLREHIARAGGDRRLVETLPKRGYRLNARVDREATVAGSARRSPGRRHTPAVVAVVFAGLLLLWSSGQNQRVFLPQAPGTTAPIIAILPFVDLSAERDREYFADGISDELISALGKIPQLRVIARSSSFSFKGQNPEIPTVAERLGATHVLEGSVRTDGERVRISVQLVDTTDAVNLWSETYERELDELLVVQQEIARAVADALELTFAPSDAGRPARLADGAAHADVMRARFLMHRRGPEDLLRAAALFESAVERDPEFAAAWAGLASARFILAVTEPGPFTLEATESTRLAAEQALALDPTQPEALIRMGQYLSYAGDYAAARHQFDLAFEHGINEPLVHAVSAGFATRRGEFQEAIQFYRKALELDPLSAVWRGNLATLLMRTGQLEEAWREAVTTRELAAGGTLDLRLQRMLAEIRILQGNAESAASLIEEITHRHERDFAQALLYDLKGERKMADPLIARRSSSDKLLDLLEASELQAYRGDADGAFATLSRVEAAVADLQTDIERVRWQERIMVSSYLELLREDPRWTGWLTETPPW